jgi:hypothetical protein
MRFGPAGRAGAAARVAGAAARAFGAAFAAVFTEGIPAGFVGFFDAFFAAGRA